MATKAKDGNTQGKEKKGTPSSSSSSQQTTRSIRTGKHSTPPSPDREKAPSSARSAPNYLKPTISSLNDPPKSARKNGNEDPNQKLLRRRSFDMASSISRLHKEVTSPSPRDKKATQYPERTITVRSSSFSSKVTTSTKPLVERTSKLPVSGKPQLQYSKSVKKATSPQVKKEPFSSPAPRRSRSNDLTQSLDVETKDEGKESLDHHENEEIVKKVENEVVVPSADIPKSESEEDTDVVHSETDHNDEDDKSSKPYDIPTVSEDETVSYQAAQIQEETQTTAHEEETKGKKCNDENSNGHLADNSEGHETKPKIMEAEDKGEEIKATEKATDTTDETGNNVDANEHEAEGEEEGGEGSPSLSKKLGKDLEIHIEKPKLEAAAGIVSPMQQGPGTTPGKKESPVYNDVIEETASKLLVRNKNKVRALVGAFETVIDYESASK